MEGPRWNLDEEAEVWSRSGPTKVILKRLDNSQNMSQEFVNQVSIIKDTKCKKNLALLLKGEFLRKSVILLCSIYNPPYNHTSRD
jgi:hypothetical protein